MGYGWVGEEGGGENGWSEKDKFLGRTFPIKPGYAGEGHRGVPVTSDDCFGLSKYLCSSQEFAFRIYRKTESDNLGNSPYSSDIISPFDQLDMIKMASFEEITERDETCCAASDDENAFWLWLWVEDRDCHGGLCMFYEGFFLVIQDDRTPILSISILREYMAKKGAGGQIIPTNCAIC